MKCIVRIGLSIYCLFAFCVIWMTNTVDQRFKNSSHEEALFNKKPTRFAVNTVSEKGYSKQTVNISETSLSPDDKAKFDALYKEHDFNASVSNMISLTRKLNPQIPQRCKDMRYPSNLPQISIVIPFRDEVLSVLLRTMYSILGNTDSSLLKEIILVDDGSTKDELKSPLETHIHSSEKASLIRLPTSVGLMMARQAGIDRATSEYFAVLDSHMEVTEGWLEPLLARLLENPKALLCSRVGVIDKNNFNVWWPTEDKPGYFPFFTWELEQEWAFYKQDFLDTIQNPTRPVPYGTVQGMMIVMKRSWFLQLGGFDPGMKLWGTEQMELSVKERFLSASDYYPVWTCGGVVEMVPCSYVAHLYRKVIWKFENHEAIINKRRFADVWMDEFKDYLYTLVGKDGVQIGDIEDRKRIRRENNCVSFHSYVTNMQKIGYVYHPGKVLFRGHLCNQRHKKCLFYREEKLVLTERQYAENEKLVHRPTGKCLSATDEDNVSLEACTQNESQFWLWD